MGLFPVQGMNILHATRWQNTYIGCSVAELCLTPCDRMNCSMPDFPVLHYLLEFAQVCCPLSRWYHSTISSSVTLFSSSPQSFPGSESFPGSQFFTSGGQKHWSFSFSPSSEYAGLISFRTDWFDLLVVILLLSYVWLFVTPWTAAHQAPMFSAISWSLLKFMSIE